MNGTTTIVFRRKLEANGPTDYTIENDLMNVIWARGQEPGNYVHVPASGLEKEMASVQEFYKPDELKYHGHKSQRGATQINFFTETMTENIGASGHELTNDCHGHWRYPHDCILEKANCEYYVAWETVGRGDEVKFHIETTNTATWTGIGFSKDNRMVNK